MHVIRKIVATGAAVAAVSTAGVSPALADPNVTPPLKSIVGAGSATLDPAMRSVVVNYNDDHKVRLYSWNAVSPTTSQPAQRRRH